MSDKVQYKQRDLAQLKDEEFMVMPNPARRSYATAVERAIRTIAACSGICGGSAAPAWLDAPISEGIIDLSVKTASTNQIGLQALPLWLTGRISGTWYCFCIRARRHWADEDYGSTVLLNPSRGRRCWFGFPSIDGDNRYHTEEPQRLSVSKHDVKKRNVFKFSFSRQTNIASLKIIAPVALFAYIMSAGDIWWWEYLLWFCDV